MYDIFVSLVEGILQGKLSTLSGHK